MTETTTKTKTRTAIIVGVIAVAALGLAAGIGYFSVKRPAKQCVGGPKALQGKYCTKDLDCLGGRCVYRPLTNPTVPTTKKLPY
ncbi:MAG: hypothetical protein WC551_02355 [Patescibacteria group bacterium]